MHRKARSLLLPVTFGLLFSVPFLGCTQSGGTNNSPSGGSSSGGVSSGGASGNGGSGSGGSANGGSAAKGGNAGLMVSLCYGLGRQLQLKTKFRRRSRRRVHTKAGQGTRSKAAWTRSKNHESDRAFCKASRDDHNYNGGDVLFRGVSLQEFTGISATSS